jgi:DNA-binding MarR family transcriptional regulator
MSRTRTPSPTTPARVEDADRLYRALARLIRWSRRASVSPVGPGTLAALGTICDCGPLRLGELAQREGVTPATLSRIVGGLEDDGYINRSVDPADRRSTFVTATTSGRKLVADVRGLRAAALLDQLRRLDDEQRTALIGALGALEALVEDV